MKNSKKIIFYDPYVGLFYRVAWSIDELYEYAETLRSMQEDGALTWTGYFDYLDQIIPNFKVPPIYKWLERCGMINAKINRPIAVTAMHSGYPGINEVISYSFYR